MKVKKLIEILSKYPGEYIVDLYMDEQTDGLCIEDLTGKNNDPISRYVEIIAF